MSMAGPVMQHCCCLAAGSQTHHSRRELSTEWILFGCVQFKPPSHGIYCEKRHPLVEKEHCASVLLSEP